MKASVFSGILLTVVIILVVINAQFVRQTTDTLSEMLASLPQEPSAEAAHMAEDILSFLEARETLLSLSVPYSTLDRGVELLNSLMAYAAMESRYEYAATKTLLMDAFKDMGRLDKMELKNLF